MIQPFDGIDSYDLSNTNTQQNNARQQNSGNQAQYRERSFKELVDEDKHSYVSRKVFSSLLGGYRFVFDEQTEKKLPIFLHLAQILIMFIVPASCVIAAFVFPNDRLLASLIVGGLIPFFINIILMVTSKSIKIQQQQQKYPGIDDDTVSCFSQESFHFLFPIKESWIQIIYTGLMTYIFGALMAYFIHPRTIDVWNGTIDSTLIQSIPYLIMISVSSFSLFSQQCPEVAIYRDNDQEFNWGSNHYQRSIYCSLISAILVICEQSVQPLPLIAAQWLYNMFIIIYFIQLFGILSNPFVTLMWIAEQTNIHILGGTPRCSDSRIVLSLVMNSLFVSLPIYLYSALPSLSVWSLNQDLLQKISFFRLSIVLLSYFSSHNFLFDLGIQQRQIADNQRLNQQKEYSNIVFSKNINTQNKEQNQNGNYVYSFFQSVVMMIILGMLSFFVGFDNTQQIYIIPLAVSLGLTLIIITVSLISRHTILKIIPCANLKQNKIIMQFQIILKLLVQIGLSSTYLLLFTIDNPDGTLQINEGIQIIFIYRAFCKAYNDPELASVESIILFWTNSPGVLLAFSVCLNRIFLLRRKATYILVSVITAVSNKKQSFKNQSICFLIQYTLMLPIVILVLLVSTVFDSATVPFLGFAFFIIGYPKPLRGWSQINRAEANPNDSRSDGHIYQAMLPDLSSQLRDIINQDPLSFRNCQYYLLKNEKMIILIQVLERGNNFCIFSIKGAELQETTVCHAEENGRINQVCEEIFEKNKRSLNFSFSLSALRQLQFDAYDDQKVSLSGIISHPDFEKLVKNSFIRIILWQIKNSYAQNIAMNLFKIYKTDLSANKVQQIKGFYDKKWLQFLNFDYDELNFQPIPKSQIVQKNTINQILPQNSNQITNKNVPQKMTFLEKLEEEKKINMNKDSTLNIPVQNQSQQIFKKPMIPIISDKKNLIQVQDDKFELKDEDFFDEDKNTSNNILLQKKANYQVPQVQKNIKKNQQRNDIDDLEDMLDNLEGGDISDILDEFEGIGNNQIDKKQQQIQNRRQSKDDELESSGATRQPNPSQNSDGLKQFQAKEQTIARPLSSRNAQSQGKKSRIQPKEVPDIEIFMNEAFDLLFGDEYQNMPSILLNIFQGKFKNSFDNREFIDSQDKGVLTLKYLILQAARQAFHYALECYIMGEVDLPEFSLFQNEIIQMDQEWFFGSEEFLWNEAIKRKCINLERLIQKKDGQYFAHRLKYGQSKDSQFNLFKFRSEVIRGIWANQNMELLFYTNANDERFSIQAEKDILRNLLIQLAEIPLGYPVYSSGPQQIII